MASSNDRQYLEVHRGKYRVTYGVPADVRDVLGTRLKRSLLTDSLSTANSRKWDVVNEFRALIAETRRRKEGDRGALLREAAQLLKLRGKEKDDVLYDHIWKRVDAIKGAAVGVEVDSTGEPFEIHDPQKTALSKEYQQVAYGARQPLRLHYDSYVSMKLNGELKLKARTIDDDLRALELFERWCRANDVEDDVRAITAKTAKQFARDLINFEHPMQPITRKKHIGRLSQYWEFLAYDEIVPANPFASVKIVVKDDTLEEAERPFHDDEIRRLLIGPCTPQMRDLMMLGALTGARIDAIIDLRVKHCQNGEFNFKAQKKELSGRDVPIHSGLKEIVERRCTAKQPDDWLFPEFPPPREGSHREHSAQASKRFGKYRQVVGVHDLVEGHRRSRVNFHSFRRWFITKAEGADQFPTIISAVVGHARDGTTLKIYSGGPEWEQARRCVEAVTLPPLDKGPVPNTRRLTRR